MKIRELIKISNEYLKDQKYTNPHLESRNILANLLNKDISYIFAHDDLDVEDEIYKIFLSILNRRKNSEPLQYIFSKTEFMKREFYVDKNVLIPRNDTEISVETLIKLIKENNLKTMLEIGTGSGIVAISTNLETKIEVIATDISRKALKVAKKNNRKLKARVEFLESDIFSNVCGKYDIIYSNPPYIRSNDIEDLERDVKDFEPRIALDGGRDGLFFYRKIIKDADKFLNENGYLVFEIGYDQREDLYKLLENKYEVTHIRDYNNKNRVIIAKRGM